MSPSPSPAPAAHRSSSSFAPARRQRRLPLAAVAALALLLGAGCASVDPKLSDQGPTYAPKNVRGFDRWPADVTRVAVFPAHDVGARLTPEFTATYDPAWTRALDRAQRTEFVSVPRSTVRLWTGRETLGSTDLLPHGLLQRIALETGAQAVLFLDLTHVKAYPPLALGLRSKLVRVPAGDVMWMVDEVFDAAAADVARAARHHARAGSNPAKPGDPTFAVAQSPANFADYVFTAITPLLPPHLPPESEGAAKTSATR